MGNRIEIEDVGGLVQKYADIFVNESNKVIDENKDIFTPEILELYYGVYTERLTERFIHELADNSGIVNTKKRYSINQLVKYDKVFSISNGYTIFAANCYFTSNDDGFVEIKLMRLLISEEKLTERVLSNLYRLDVLEEIVKFDARHEVGHLMDYVLTMHNHPMEEVKKLNDDNAAAKKEYYDYIERSYDYLHKCSDEEYYNEQKKILQMYFNLPGEFRADTLGGIDRAKMIELDMDRYDKHSIVIETL